MHGIENVKYNVYSLEDKEFREATMHRRTAIRPLRYFILILWWTYHLRSSSQNR